MNVNSFSCTHSHLHLTINIVFVSFVFTTTTLVHKFYRLPKKFENCSCKMKKRILYSCSATAYQGGQKNRDGKTNAVFFRRFPTNDNTRYMSHVNYIEHVQIKSLI